MTPVDQSVREEGTWLGLGVGLGLGLGLGPGLGLEGEGGGHDELFLGLLVLTDHRVLAHLVRGRVGVRARARVRAGVRP